MSEKKKVIKRNIITTIILSFITLIIGIAGFFVFIREDTYNIILYIILFFSLFNILISSAILLGCIGTILEYKKQQNINNKKLFHMILNNTEVEALKSWDSENIFLICLSIVICIFLLINLII